VPRRPATAELARRGRRIGRVSATGPSHTIHRTILHVDLDAFFASVEQRDHPEWRGKPLAVGMGGTNDRGVVSAASYEARKFGVRSAMPIRTAKRLCPDCIFVPVRGAAYQAASREVMAILRRFTPLVQPISIDEAFLDVTASRALFGDGEAIARRIKEAVRAEVELTISVGVASTKLVAKIASDLRKPDGLVVVPPGTEVEFLAPLPIGRLWGVGASTATALRDFGVATIGDLQRVDRSALARRLGKHGATLVDRAHGRDPDPVDDPDAAKSVSHEMTFDQDTSDPEVLERTLLAMSEGVSGRLRHAGLKAGTVTVKIRDSGFNTITRQRGLPEPSDMTEPIWQAALALARPEMRGKKIRLLGVAASGFREKEQLGLFGAADDRKRKVVAAADEIRERFGTRAITRARILRSGVSAPFERDFGSSVERRGDLAADVARDARKRRSDRDRQPDTEPIDDPFDE
jgi:DNA polymerase-4